VNAAEVVNTLLVQRFGVPAVDITDETPLRSLQMDSLALEELRVLIEEQLDVDLEEVSLTSRDTVGHLVAAIDGKVAA
jgi:acyl carrier protein